MQRLFALVSIFLLLFTQMTPATSIAIAQSSSKSFSVDENDEATDEEAEIHLTSLSEESFDAVEIQLPDQAVYNQQLTKELEQHATNIFYNEKQHILIIEWKEGTEQTAKFVLESLPSLENELLVSGIIDEETIVENEKHTFLVAEASKEVVVEDAEATETSAPDDTEGEDQDSIGETEAKEEDQKSDDEAEIKGEDQKSDDEAEIKGEDQKSDDEAEIKGEDQKSDDEAEIKEEDQKSDDEAEVKEDDQKSEAKAEKDQQISKAALNDDDDSSIEDLNSYLSIDPVFETALSGADANFKLTLKLTGAKRTYKNVDVVIDLPIEEHITFDDAQENLESLAIDGVTPTFNNETNQLTYHFDEIKRGQMYEKIISLNTENGYILDDTSVEVGASISGEIHYTENDEKEEAQKGDVVPLEYEDSGSMLITASGALSLSKFRVNESEHEYGDSSIVARGQEILWKLELEIPKKDRGQLFLNPDEKITMTDTLPAELEYVEIHSGNEPTFVDNQTLTWEFDVDDFNIQEEKEKELYSTEIIIKTKVSDDAPKGELKNDAAASATFIEDIAVTDNASRGIRVAIDDPATGEIEGTITVPTHLGPDPSADNGLGDNDNKNPRPEVTDDTILRFSHGIAPMNESFPDRDQYPSGNSGPAKNFIEFQTFYEIDQHLNLESMRAPGPFQFKPNNAYPSGEFFKEQPRYDIKARIDGSSTFQTLVEADAVIQGKVYTREELGLQPGQKVSEIKIEFLKGYMGNSNEVAPGGMHSTNTVLFEFSIDEGFTGTVENKFNVTGVNGNNERFNDREKNPNRYDNSTGSDISGPRQATVVEYNQQAEPVGRVGVKLLDDVQGVVTNGNNRMHVELVNVNNSGAPMNSILETVVLLPPGVTLHDEVNPSYTNAQGENTDAASYEVLEEDYNGSGRQLVRVKWDDARITKGQNLQAELDVYISDHAPNQLIFDVYGFSSDEGLQAPSNTGGGITDTVLQIDTEDLNGNGNTEQPRLKSGNIYSLTGKYDIQTEKLIKGPNDEDFSKFTLAPFDGTVDYKLKMTNTTGKDLSSMTLIDVLPTIGDLGITDNVNRGSTFDPILEGPIDLPAVWQDKVNVSYSTAKNPERDDLTRHTDYLPDAPQLTNPEGAEAPNWVPASEVTDWSTIHSFKIELQPGDTWIKGQDIEIDFTMTMPSETDVEEEVKNIDLVPQQCAAWNSFAVATDQGHPVEPERVGVAIETFIDIPVEKVWEGEAQDEVTINLLADGEEVATIELSDENDWAHVFEDLPTANGEEAIDYTIEEVSVDGYDTNITGNAEDGFVVTNTELTNIPVEKVWEGEAQDDVTINLLADGEEVESIVLSNENDWTHVFENLPVANSDGTITYTVEEVEIDGYDTNITGNAEDGFVVTNTELTNIPVEKVWEGEAQDEVTIHLLADGEEIDTIILSSENDWQHVFEDLPVAKGADTIAYTVEEVEIDGYDTTIICNAENGFVVTNTELTNIPVKKVWEGEAQDTVTINLLANGEEVDTVVLSGKNNWQYVFEDFPVANGEETIAYTVEEVAIDGYETNIIGNAEDGFVVTNTLNPPETPGVEKEVEDNEGEFTKDLVEKEREKEYKYNVNTVVPENLLGYEYMTLEDELDERLDVLAAVALVDGEAVDYEVVIEDQLVTLRVDREQLEEIAGQAVTLQITAQIKAGVEVEVIDNQATIQVNENPREDSNKVPVIPPPVTPDIEKDIDGVKAEEAVEKLRGELYEYNVTTTLPENVAGFETVHIADELDDRLGVEGAKVLVDGDASNLEAVIEGQLVTVTLDEDQIEELAGKEIKLVITAKINDDVEIDIIDNQASIQVNDLPRKDSNIVPVTPEDPPTTPKIDKDVEGTGHLDVDYDKEYKYNVITTLPSNIEAYEKFVITDEVDKGLVVNGDKVTATVDGEAYDGLDVTVDGNDVKVKVTDFAGLAGKGQIELVIPAKIHPDTNIDDYKDNKIPNTASLDYINESGDEGNLETDPVTVTPPPTPEDPPTTPVDPTPEDPTPKDPATPDDSPASDKTGSTLPITASDAFNILLVGLVLLITGGAVAAYRRKRKNATNIGVVEDLDQK